MLDKEHIENYMMYQEIDKDAIFHDLENMHVRKTLQTIRSIKENGKYFICNDGILEYLSPEKTDNTIDLRQLPFDKILLLNNMKIENKLIRGLCIIGCHYSDKNLMNGIKFFFYVQHNKEDCQLYMGDLIDMGINKINLISSDNELQWRTEDELLIYKMRIFICNYLDFLNIPDVEIIEVKRDIDVNLKRVQRGKVPLPDISYVRVNGKLKIYLSQLNSDGRFQFSHRFWVRGHFRTLRNEERFGNKVGTKIWILPFIKGQGILIDKMYKVKV